MLKILFLDIETDKLDAEKIHVVVCKDGQTETLNYFTKASIFNKFILNYDILVGHNIVSFDAPVLNRLWNSCIPISKIVDTFLLSALFNPDREGKHSLAAWGKRLDLEKIEYLDFSEFNSEMLKYCINDVEFTYKLYH